MGCSNTRLRSVWRRALPRNVRNRLTEYAADAGLPAGSLGRPAEELSGGQRQAVNLLSILARPKRAALVLLDEPLNSLDQANQSRCSRLIRSMHEQGMTVLMVSHTGMGIDFDYREIDLDQIGVAAASSHVATMVNHERRIAG